MPSPTLLGGELKA